jgi:hypothetical protein
VNESSNKIVFWRKTVWSEGFFHLLNFLWSAQCFSIESRYKLTNTLLKHLLFLLNDDPFNKKFVSTEPLHHVSDYKIRLNCALIHELFNKIALHIHIPFFCILFEIVTVNRFRLQIAVKSFLCLLSFFFYGGLISGISKVYINFFYAYFGGSIIVLLVFIFLESWKVRLIFFLLLSLFNSRKWLLYLNFLRFRL